MKAFILLILCASIHLVAQSISPIAPQPIEQPDKARVALLARAYGDSIVLRYAPSNYQVWIHCNEVGVKIERVTILENGKLGERKSEILTPVALKPLPEAGWKQYFKPESPAIVYYGCLFQKDKEVPSNSIGGIISQSQNESMRHGMAMFAADQSPQVAVLAGLRYSDKNVRKGSSYLYRVYPSTQIAGYPIDTGLVYLAPDEISQLPKIPDFKGDFKSRVVELSWEIKYLKGIYSSYVTEISEDGKTWKKTSKTPVVGMKQHGEKNPDRQFKIDSLPVNQKFFSFRVRGINAFGETGPPSDTIKGMGLSPALSVFPVLNVATPLPDGSMLLKWKFPDTANARFKHFELLRSDFKSKTEYTILQKVIPINTREFIDPKPLRAQYYVLRAYDQFNRVATSYPMMANLKDSIPPKIPSGISGKVDSTGIVTLKWKKNSEDDIMGYRLFRANHIKEEFVSVTGHIYYDSIYVDTINVETLTSKVYYRLVAVDQNYNHSDFSTALELQRPDLIPPAAPVINGLSSISDGVQIKWIPSYSKDVVVHVLYKRLVGQKSWTTIAVVDTSLKQYSFLDKDVKAGSDYEYILLAVDHSKLESVPMNPVFIHHFEGLNNITVEKLKGVVNGNTINLSWKYDGKATKFEIFRAVNLDPPTFYRNTEGLVKTYTDAKIVPGNIYKYYVRAVLDGGKIGPFSEEVKVEY